MLEYYKEILGKVSFDSSLFNKEVRKAYLTLMEDEKRALQNWLQEKH